MAARRAELVREILPVRSPRCFLHHARGCGSRVSSAIFVSICYVSPSLSLTHILASPRHSTPSVFFKLNAAMFTFHPSFEFIASFVRCAPRHNMTIADARVCAQLFRLVSFNFHHNAQTAHDSRLGRFLEK